MQGRTSRVLFKEHPNPLHNFIQHTWESQLHWQINSPHVLHCQSEVMGASSVKGRNCSRTHISQTDCILWLSPQTSITTGQGSIFISLTATGAREEMCALVHDGRGVFIHSSQPLIHAPDRLAPGSGASPLLTSLRRLPCHPFTHVSLFCWRHPALLSLFQTLSSLGRAETVPWQTDRNASSLVCLFSSKAPPLLSWASQAFAFSPDPEATTLLWPWLHVSHEN